MTGIKLGVVVLGMALLAGVTEIQKSVDNLLCNNSRALYVMAQYKIAVGDTKSALQLVRKAKDTHVSGSETKATIQNSARGECPYSHRG